MTQQRVEMVPYIVLPYTLHLLLQSWCVSKACVIKVLYDVSKYMLWIRLLAVPVFIGFSVFSFDKLECLRSDCCSRWGIHFSLPKELFHKLYLTNPAFHCSAEGVFQI